MALTLLRAVLAPPAQPADTGTAEGWLTVEESLGTALPGDYKEYIDVFGTGGIDEFLYPFNPFSSEKHMNLVEQRHVRLWALRTLKERWGDRECPYPLYPETGGLLPWGATGNGDVLFWLTVGDPDAWPTVINESRGPMFEQYDESMTDFLALLIAGQIKSQIFPRDFPGREAVFTQ